MKPPSTATGKKNDGSSSRRRTGTAVSFSQRSGSTPPATTSNHQAPPGASNNPVAKPAPWQLADAYTGGKPVNVRGASRLLEGRKRKQSSQTKTGRIGRCLTYSMHQACHVEPPVT